MSFKDSALHFKSDSAFVSQRVKGVLKDSDALGGEKEARDKLVKVKEVEIIPSQEKKKKTRAERRMAAQDR